MNLDVTQLAQQVYRASGFAQNVLIRYRTVQEGKVDYVLAAFVLDDSVRGDNSERDFPSNELTWVHGKVYLRRFSGSSGSDRVSFSSGKVPDSVKNRWLSNRCAESDHLWKTFV